MVLVDSSVWIDLLRNQSTPQTTALRKLLEDNSAALAPVVYQEILQGAASAERLVKLREYFSTLPFLLPTHPIKTYEKAAELYARCRFRGYTPRVHMIALSQVLPLSIRCDCCTMIEILKRLH